jgi:hypothetical protein
MRAIHLLGVVLERYDRRLNLKTFYEQPTIRHLERCMLAVPPGDSGVPVEVLHERRAEIAREDEQ